MLCVRKFTTHDVDTRIVGVLKFGAKRKNPRDTGLRGFLDGQKTECNVSSLGGDSSKTYTKSFCPSTKMDRRNLPRR